MKKKESGKKSVCLRDRLMQEKEVIRQRNVEINDHLRALDKESAIKWVNARVRECRVIAKQATLSRIISEAHQKELVNIWGKIFRHDLDPEMVARAAEIVGNKQSKPLKSILGDEYSSFKATSSVDPVAGDTLREIVPD